MLRREFIRSAGSVLALGAMTDYSQTSNLKVAVIGHTGRGNYGHGLDIMWVDASGCDLAAVADPDQQGLKKAQERLKGVRPYSDYKEMLRREKPDIVSVAPRHIDQHRDMLLACAEAGVKGVYMEKPFCRDLGEARQIVSVCREKGLKLALAHRNRYHPALKVAQQMVESGELGQVLEVRGRGKEDHRGGAQDLWVLGSHLLNLMPLFTGAFISCSARIYAGNRPVQKMDLREGDEGVGLVGGDRLHARFLTDKGVPAYFDSIRAAGVNEGNFGFQILGNKGVLDVRIDTEPLVSFLPVNAFFPRKGRLEWMPVTSGGVNVPEPIQTIETDIAGHQAAARDLVEAVRTGKKPLCNELEGLATVEAIMAVFESHRQGGSEVRFPLAMDRNPLEKLS